MSLLSFSTVIAWFRCVLYFFSSLRLFGVYIMDLNVSENPVQALATAVAHVTATDAENVSHLSTSDLENVGHFLD